MATRKQAIPNRVFIGCPWKTVRPKYESAIRVLVKQFPIAFRIVGRADNQSADDLFLRIKDTLFSSSYAVFDLTGGNPNVSLEYGLADSIGLDRAIYISNRKTEKRTKDSAIIADLAGLNRQQYKEQSGLQRHLKDLCEAHPYTKQFTVFMGRYRKRSPGERKRLRALALKIIHSLDNEQSRRRVEVIQQLQGDQVGYADPEINTMILKLHQAKLIKSGQGPYATISLSIGTRRLAKTG